MRDWGPLWSFLTKNIYTPTHVHAFLHSQADVWVFQSPWWTSHFPAVNLKFFWLASCFPQLLLLPQAAAMLNNCNDRFWQVSQEKDFLHWVSFETGQIMTRPESGSSQKATRWSNHGHSLGIRLSSEHILTHPVDSRLLFYTTPMMANLLLFKASSELEKREWE